MKPTILLTVPHGAPGNDALAPPVAKALYEQLTKAGITVELVVSECCRYMRADMNRPEGRGSQFRQAIAEVVEQSQPKLHIDVHSFPSCIKRFDCQDIVLLHTPDLQCENWLKSYARKLAETKGLRVGVMPSEYPNDVCRQVRENGLAENCLMLAEHNNDGNPEHYAAAHVRAIKAVLAERDNERQAD